MTDLPLFDPADYLDTEEGFAAYLADARADGADALSDAVAVVSRARDRLSRGSPQRNAQDMGQRDLRRADGSGFMAAGREGRSSGGQVPGDTEMSALQALRGLRFDIYTDSQGQYRWRLFAANNRKIADSGEGYFNRSDCLSAINLVKTSASAPVG